MVQIGDLLDDRLDIRLKPIARSLKNLEKESRKTNRNIDIIVRTFDNEHLRLKKRVERLEEKVGITS